MTCSEAYARVIIIDFSKAFDHIDHQMLLEKMQSQGVRGYIQRWTHSFLKERQHLVKIGATLSDWATPNGGGPQGTLAGPLHYQLMSNDFNCHLSGHAEVCRRQHKL